MKTIIWIALSLSFGWAQAKESVPPGSALVPYDSQRVLETFSKTVHGGIMHLVAKSAADGDQIKRIQQYFRQTAAEYMKGDFSSTERFHGMDMPGLAQMKAAKAGDIRYEYKALKNGGQIHFSTEYPPLLAALHRWFDTQIQEHGNPVLPDHQQHHASPAE